MASRSFRLLGACAWLLAVVTGASAADPKPNIVFILADDLGYTDLACNGSRYYETPHLDRLAAEGVRFTSGYTCGPNCQPTRAALLSGQYGPRTGVYTVGSIDRFPWETRRLRPVDNVQNLPLDKVTIAQTLKRAGYATALFGKWHLGNNDAHHPSQRGFDEAIVSAGAHFDFKTNPPTEYPPGTYLADFLTDRAVDFVRRHRDEPFFLYLPHYGVHAPHQAKPELAEHFKSKTPVGGHRDPAYAGMIASVDQSVGRIVALLEELQLSERTLVIFASDNGGVGGYEREGIHGGDATDNAPLRGGKGMLYEGGIRVPYIFRWTGQIAAGKTNDTPINSVDLYPTLVEVASAERPADYPLDGTSYAELLTATEPHATSRGDLFWHFPGYLGAKENTWRTTPVGVIRSGDWKLLEFFEDGRRELYNLKEDLSERHDLSASQPEKAAELYQKLVAWRKSVKAPQPTPHEPEKEQPRGKGKKARRQNQADN